jgi:hypothetical protein
MNYRLPVWSDLYLTVASQMAAHRWIDGDDLFMLLPKDYLAPDVSYASVFGVKTAANWSFYLSVNKKTRKLWPA